VSAQQLRAEIREQSERESQLILREARAQADHIIEAARAEIRALQEELSSLERTRRSYLTQMRLMVERQLADVSALEKSSGASKDAERGSGGNHGADAARSSGESTRAESAERREAPVPPKVASRGERE